MEKKSVGIFILVALLVLPSVMAVETEVWVKTVSYADDVQVSVFDASAEGAFSQKLIGAKGSADAYGDFKHTFDISSEKYNLIIFIKKDKEDITPMGGQQILDKTAGEFFYVQIPEGLNLPKTPGYENGIKIEETPIVEPNVTNETELGEIASLDTNTTNLSSENSTKKSKSFVNAFVVLKNNIFSKKTLYFTGGLLLLVAITGFGVGYVKKRKNSHMDQLNELKKEQQEDLQEKREDIKNYKQVIEEAEQKIAEAQRDIKKLKNEERIKEMKKKIKEDEKELMRLREGKD